MSQGKDALLLFAALIGYSLLYFHIAMKGVMRDCIGYNVAGIH